MEVAGLEQDEKTPVCTNTLFKFMDPNTLNRWRRQYFANHGASRAHAEVVVVTFGHAVLSMMNSRNFSKTSDLLATFQTN